MSQELERVYTINLGKVLLSPDNRRATRAINMIKEYASHHMKIEEIKIEEELSHLIWKRGIRSPPRKIRVRMSRTDEGFVLVSPYDEEVETKITPTKESAKVDDAVEEPESTKTVEETIDESIEDEVKEAPKKEAPKKEAPKKEAPKKEAPKKEAPKKEAPKKEAPKKEAPKKE